MDILLKLFQTFSCWPNSLEIWETYGPYFRKLINSEILRNPSLTFPLSANNSSLLKTLKGQNLRLIYQRNIHAISISNDRFICSDLLRYFTDSIFNPERVNLNNWLTIWNRGNAHMYIRNAISESVILKINPWTGFSKGDSKSWRILFYR